jgi:outer membrane porin, OprD family
MAHELGGRSVKLARKRSSVASLAEVSLEAQEGSRQFAQEVSTVARDGSMSMNSSDKFLECSVESSKSKHVPGRSKLVRIIVAAWIGTCVGLVGVVAESKAQQLLPADREEIADQERLSWTPQKFPPQPYMNEIYWPYSKDTPAFFRDSLLQIVARTYYLTRDNFDGSRSQAWAAGGWLAFRSGLIGDVFGVHVAGYTSQPIFAPLDEGGTKLLAPPQNSIGVLGQVYGRIQIGDQEIRGGRQLVDTPLINPFDVRMVPNTFEGATLVSLPDKDRNYDYSVG